MASPTSPARAFTAAQREIRDIDVVPAQHGAHVADHAGHVHVLHEDQVTRSAALRNRCRPPAAAAACPSRHRAFHGGDAVSVSSSRRMESVWPARLSCASATVQPRCSAQSAWRSPRCALRRSDRLSTPASPALRSRLVLLSAILPK